MTHTASDVSTSQPGESAPPMVRVVVINFDGGPITLRCLDSLLATDYPADRLEIVVVDNASVDGLLWVIRDEYPTVRLIVSDVNEGFARGCNLAMRDLDGVDYLALINNDAIVGPNWLHPLLESCSPDGVGAAVPKLLLNLETGIVLLEGPVDGSVRGTDGPCAVGVGVTSVRYGGRELIDRLRFDERFWGDWEITVESRRAKWAKRSTASFWWPIEMIATGETVEVDLCLPPGAPSGEWYVGDGSTRQRVDFVDGGATVHVTNHVPRRIINSAGSELYAGWAGGDRGFLQPDLGQFDTPAEVFAWCGGAVVLKADYLRAVGIFDPQYFLYYEDFDLSWRGRSQGWRYVYDPRATVLHEHAYSSREGSDFFKFWVDRNRRLTLIKNAPARVALRAVLGTFGQFLEEGRAHVLGQARRRRPPSPRWCWHRVRGLWRVVSAMPAAWLERRRLARRRVVGDREIAAWLVTK
ncbi:MAG: glycosyltransferase [Ilumatobacteraceae bacterium]